MAGVRFSPPLFYLPVVLCTAGLFLQKKTNYSIIKYIMLNYFTAYYAVDLLILFYKSSIYLFLGGIKIL